MQLNLLARYVHYFYVHYLNVSPIYAMGDGG